ncbi:hypothetical protein B723_28230 [Pseudomonas fluorescens NCIMB 11764]|uniref:Uncharacterized protein n=1 Tax=Pseudomonas fluorescens NCIMB 11764 TaxID=1221522 RepID=A0A0K1QWI3_PSEFL|nr:hypothetical protein B723_28230 [Pseudomonas fluorescens NCIMB 11764]
MICKPVKLTTQKSRLQQSLLFIRLLSSYLQKGSVKRSLHFRTSAFSRFLPLASVSLELVIPIARGRNRSILLKKSAMVSTTQKYALEIEIFTLSLGFGAQISRSDAQKRRFQRSVWGQSGRTDFFNRIADIRHSLLTSRCGETMTELAVWVALPVTDTIFHGQTN